ncbi:hypothetical protein HYQ45_009214 [Verticillium longisporum]|uniref:DUF1479 domain protein n=1 Tax=Verticillium longisporum TaxID=100787 RepID=A0A8I3ASJ1_VERLO|nr:hypothetical protein HYQ45_009214 [Verticillium longisporum]
MMDQDQSEHDGHDQSSQQQHDFSSYANVPFTDDLFNVPMPSYGSPGMAWPDSLPYDMDQFNQFQRNWPDMDYGMSSPPPPPVPQMPRAPEAPPQLPRRFAQIKQGLVAGKENAIAKSWDRLLVSLRAEIALIEVTKSDVIPTIDFADLEDRDKVTEFSAKLKKRGAAVIRKVVPSEDVMEWKEETDGYLASNPGTKAWPTRDPHLMGIYWTPAQIKGRGHPNVLAAQKFLMSLWHSTDAEAQVSNNFPVSYADRLRINTPGESNWHLNAHVDGGSVERWEPDGYGRAGTYRAIWDGRWEDYDPWESSSRLKVTSDLYNGAGSCSMFRMFQGWLSMASIDPSEGTLLLCPMLQLATAYFLLRPFFSPRVPASASPSTAAFLASDNWALDFSQTSILQGAVPSYTQELNNVLHPHLHLDKSLVRVPRVEPGDYIAWHPDMVYGGDKVSPVTAPATIMYIPACPLTQTNALYLARQRKTFLLGRPSPDFGGGIGEATHVGRPGTQEVNDAGGDEALRAMGLLPWEEDDASGQHEVQLLRMANGILFPDRYDMMV